MGTRAFRTTRVCCSLAAVFLAVVVAPTARAGQDAAGSVRLPLGAYQDLMGRVQAAAEQAGPPVAATLSAARVEVEVPDRRGRPARVNAQVTVHVLADDWVPVPLLPAGTPVAAARLADAPIALAPVRGELVWSTRGKGTHTLALSYTVPVIEDDGGRAVELPLPAAASINLTLRIPGMGLAVSVVPASGVETTEEAGVTELRADVPRTSAVRVGWRLPRQRDAMVVAASYQGELKQQSVVSWHAELDVKVYTPDPVCVPLVANQVALAELSVDDRTAVVEERDGRLCARMRGAGAHRARLRFETGVRSEQGPTSTSLWLPRPPRTAFRLTLPGRKHVAVEPKAGVTTVQRGKSTLASVHLPPTERVTFSWSEARPEVGREKLRANAEIHHAVRAEEGVVKLDAMVAYQVTRGATNKLTWRLPAGVAVNRVTGEGVRDWRSIRGKEEQVLEVYLDRDLKAEARYVISYELLVGGGDAGDHPVELPLLRADEVHRQRGMVALLAGTELSMQPRQSRGMTKVGENQLPTWVRQRIGATVGHTFKYFEPDAGLGVGLAPPERKRGRFDAVVDTLYAVGDGVMKGLATVEVAIKSGKIMDLELGLPKAINLIGVTAPSLRDHRVTGADGRERLLQLMFTQELEGRLRIEVAFERVLEGGQERVEVPALHVVGADMEQGRLAVEALTAVEVQPAEVSRLQPLDAQELPRRMTLRTTNPILLAYKYVHNEPAFRLALEIKHHAELAVQVAAIDEARYQTLVTRHGLSLSRALYRIRNRRKQFLEVALPPGSELWSAMLAGEPVKPARGERKSVVLVPLLKSQAPFEVELVYATSVPALGNCGWLQGRLPVPDIVETRTGWDLFLPDTLGYGRIDTDMRVLENGGVPVAVPEREAALDGLRAAAGEHDGRVAGTQGPAGVLPLRIEVPRHGVHLRLEKLFTNRGEAGAGFRIHYHTAGARGTGNLLLVLGVLALAAVAAGRAGLVGNARMRGARAWAVAVTAAVAMVVAVVFLGGGIAWAAAAAGACAALLAGRALLRARR